MLGLWFESARAMLFLFILLNALPVPMLRQVSKNAVLLAWELNFRGFLFFIIFCVCWGHLENSSFTCMGAQFWRSRSAILRFFVIFEKA